MSDITSNTKRFTSAIGFAGASTNDLVRIAAQAIDYAGEISLVHSQIRKDIPVAYCVFGTHFRTETTNADHETTMANVINAIREDADCIDADDDQFTFEYDGMTFRVVTEEVMDSMKEDAITNMIDEAYYELEQLKKNSCYVSNYVTLDEDMFRRDAQHDVDSWVSHYDGVVHEMYWCEYGAGRTCCGYANDASSDTVIRRGTLYMIRED
jgi:hypothetical protein